MKRAAKALSRLWTGIKRLYQRAGFYMLLAGCLAVVGISAHALRSRPPYVPRPMQQADSQKGFAQRLSEAAVPTALPTALPTAFPTASPTALPSPSPVPVDFVWPVEGEQIGEFSRDGLTYSETLGQWQTHNGVDIAAAAGQVVAAPAAGTVTECRVDLLLGNTVVIRHSAGYESQLSNLSSLNAVSEGQRVEKGAVIGSVGQSALGEAALGPHLHYELRQNGQLIDPAQVSGG